MSIFPYLCYLSPVWKDWAIYCTLGNLLKPLATINLSKSPTFLGNFCKGVKIYHFSSHLNTSLSLSIYSSVHPTVHFLSLFVLSEGRHSAQSTLITLFIETLSSTCVPYLYGGNISQDEISFQMWTVRYPHDGSSGLIKQLQSNKEDCSTYTSTYLGYTYKEILSIRFRLIECLFGSTGVVIGKVERVRLLYIKSALSKAVKLISRRRWKIVLAQVVTCGQSYEHFTLVNYDYRVNMGYFPVRYDSRVVIYEHKMFIRLATVVFIKLQNNADS